MAIENRIKEEVYLRDADGGITALSGGLAEIPVGREGDALETAVAERELAADQAKEDAFWTEQSGLAAAAAEKKRSALEAATDFEEFKVAFLL